VAYDHSNHFDGLNKTRSGLKDRLSKKLHSSLPILKMARYLKISIERPLGSDGFEKVARDVVIGYTRAGGGSVDETVGRNYSAFEQNYDVTPAQYHAYIETKASSAYDKYGPGYGADQEAERDEGLER
jgi:hypothetical protein